MTNELLGGYQFETTTRLEQTIVREQTGRQVAVLTVGARTVVVSGSPRTFRERTTPATVTTLDSVRVGPQPFRPELLADDGYAQWLAREVSVPAVDVLDVACQYVTGAPQLVDPAGVVYASDAGYGSGSTDAGAGADFFAYLGRPWTWADGKSTVPDPRFLRQLDCSGFVRLVYGYWMGIPVYRVNTPVGGLPRSSWAIAAQASVVVTQGPDAARPPASVEGILAGDLVFFALHDTAPEQISHVGIYLGVDSYGGRRFVSSRLQADGPTFGDVGGKSTLDGAFFGPRLRKVVRL